MVKLMHETEIERLRADIERMKRASRWTHLLAATAILGCLGYFAACNAAPKTDALKTSRIELVDTEGKTQAILFADKDGAVLSLNDADGKPRIVFAASRQRPTLELFDGKGKSRTTLSAENDGSTMAFTDETGLPRASIGYFKGESWAAFHDAKGNVKARVPGQ